MALTGCEDGLAPYPCLQRMRLKGRRQVVKGNPRWAEAVWSSRAILI